MKIFRGFFVLSVCLFLAAGVLFAQDEPTEAQNVESVSENSDLQWAWGEVVKTDTQLNSVTIKHLDYESGQEKEITVFIDSMTILENLKSLAELKPADILSIDYVKDKEDRNTAKMLILEKPSPAAAAVNPEPEIGADLAQQDIENIPQQEEEGLGEEGPKEGAL